MERRRNDGSLVKKVRVIGIEKSQGRDSPKEKWINVVEGAMWMMWSYRGNCDGYLDM